MDITQDTLQQPMGFAEEENAVFEEPAFRAAMIHSNLPELDYAGSEGIMNALTKGTPSLGIAAVETLGTSLGLLDEEEYQQFLSENAPNLYNYYKRNEEGIKLIADIGTAFIPATAGVKAIQGGSWLYKAAKASRIPHVDKLFTSKSHYNQVYRELRKQDLQNARKGMIGDEFEIARRPYVRRFKTQQTVDGLKEGAAAEVALFATMNESDNLYPEDAELTQHLAFAALGLALPAGLDRLAARRLVAKSARLASPAAIEALNVGGQPIDKLVGRPGEYDVPITLASIVRKGMEEQLAELAELSRADVDKQTFRNNLNKFALSVEGRVQGLVDDLANHQVEGIIPQESEDVVANVLKSAVKQDELSLLGVVGATQLPQHAIELAKLQQRRDGVVKTAKDEFDRLWNAALVKQKGGKELDSAEVKAIDDAQQKWKELEKQDLYVLSPRGEYVPLTEYKPRFRDDPSPNKPLPEFIERKNFGESMYALKQVGPNKATVTVDVTFTPSINGKAIEETLTDTDDYTVDALYSLYNHAISKFRPDRVDDIIITDKVHWMRADAIIELARTKHGADKKIKFTGDKIRTLEDLEFASISSKFEEFAELHRKMDKTEQPDTLGAAVNLIDETVDLLGEFSTAESLRHRFNLPSWTRGETYPIEELFLHFIQQGMTKVSDKNGITDRIANLADFKALVSQTVTFGDPKEAGNIIRNIPLQGTEFSTANTLPNIAVLKKNLPHDNYALARLEDGVYDQLERHLSFDNAITAYERALTAGEASETKHLIGRLAHLIRGRPNEVGKYNATYETAINVRELSDSARLGTGTINTRRFSQRELPTLQAVNDIQTIVEKEGRTFVGDLFERTNVAATEFHKKQTTHSSVFAELRNQSNVSDFVSFSSYINARAHAWDLLPDAARNQDGTYSFYLKPDSAHNRRKLNELYGEDRANELLPLDADDSFAGLKMPTTTLDRSYKPLNITARAFAGAEAFRDISRQVRKEFNILRQQTVQPPINLKEWYVPPPNFNNLHTAFIVTPLPSGGSNKFLVSGRTASELQKKLNRPNIVQFRQENQALVLTPEDFRKYFSLKHDVTFEGLEDVDVSRFAAGHTANLIADQGRAYLDDSIDFFRDQVNSLTKHFTSSLFEPQIAFARMMSDTVVNDKKPYKNIYEDYIKTLLGVRALDEQHGLGKVYTKAESLYDDTLAWIYDRTESRRIRGAVKEKIQRQTGHLTKQLEKVKSELGTDAPVELTVEQIATITNVRPPSSMTKQMAEINQITSALILRLFEVAHPLLNFSGVVSTMPSIIHAVSRHHGETRQDWMGRISAFATPYSNTKDLGVLSPVKLMSQGVYHGFTKQGSVDWDEMVKRGYGRQEVSEIQRTITNPQKALSKDKVIDVLSTLSDKSEELSRGWAHMAAVKLARDHLGMTDTGDIHLFAHKFANEVIGDYRANNRPQIFQGAVGLPLGLFQTYIWNYYQRLFSYVENRQYSALGWQTFMQANVFGAASLPGFTQFQALWHDEKKAANPIDSMNQKFGPDMTELILNGTLSNIPKLFGEDGIAIYTRGDTNFQRMPAFINPAEAPVWQLANRVFGFLRDSTDQIFEGGQYSNERQLEILATYSMNRPLSRLIELYLGESVDRRGQLISDDIYSGVSIAARVMSLRPLSEQKQIETLWRQRQTEYTQRKLRKRTRDSLRSKIRAGLLDEEAITQALRDYVEQGGNPKYFASFIKDQILAAKSPKVTNKLLQLLRSQKLHEAARLYAAFD